MLNLSVNQDPYTTIESLAKGPLDSEAVIPTLKSLRIAMTIVGGEIVHQA